MRKYFCRHSVLSTIRSSHINSSKENKMKMIKLAIIVGLTLGLGSTAVFADETAGEKIEAKTKDVKRDAKAKKHRVEEEVCDKNDEKTYADCLLKKAKNRSDEAGDAVKDKSSEVKNKVD